MTVRSILPEERSEFGGGMDACTCENHAAFMIFYVDYRKARSAQNVGNRAVPHEKWKLYLPIGEGEYLRQVVGQCYNNKLNVWTL